MIQWFNKQMSKKRKGFTLIELIVVIAILGILAAIAIPRFADVRTNAQAKADLASGRTIASAVTIAQANGNVAQPDAAAINANLNDITVTVGGTPGAATGWKVIYNGTTSEFDVFLNTTEVVNGY